MKPEDIALRRRLAEDTDIQSVFIAPLKKHLVYYKDVRNADSDDNNKRLALRDAHAEVTTILESILKELDKS
jgi:hypothetical protein